LDQDGFRALIKKVGAKRNAARNEDMRLRCVVFALVMARKVHEMKGYLAWTKADGYAINCYQTAFRGIKRIKEEVGAYSWVVWQQLEPLEEAMHQVRKEFEASEDLRHRARIFIEHMEPACDAILEEMALKGWLPNCESLPHRYIDNPSPEEVEGVLRLWKLAEARGMDRSRYPVYNAALNRIEFPEGNT
jgi:hypothetical protein